VKDLPKTMNQILILFLCGAAFIGGATTVVVMVLMAASLKDKKGRDELYGYWRDSISKHAAQIAVLERIASQLEKRKDA
jgi:hypothetical protein